MVLRMARMAEMRDPKETGTHVTRVSRFSLEIYDRWAFNHNIPAKERTAFRDSLIIASMLHDVGKVGISDLILKKPGRFDDNERNIIKAHTYICHFLFAGFVSSLDKMTLEVALHHHERWDGKGYPGKIDSSKVTSPDVIFDLHDALGLNGEEIPLSARIVAVADVFDALSHRRCYKDAWSEEDVLNELKSQSGLQFDPEVIDAFFEVYPTIKEIQDSLPDEEA
jgi:HD-GYP domain-containing protein (c-di-GMP phosphodiesterase class II)